MECIKSKSQKEYKLVRKLGEGASSEVYEAICEDHHSGLSQRLVLKILKSKNLLDIWKQEFDSLIQVKSKHCVRAYAWEWLGQRPAIVIEYTNSISLAELSNIYTWSKVEVDEICRQIEEGLRSLERYGLYHGDLNPKNIIIDVEGCLRLLDYGLANKEFTTSKYASEARLSGISPASLKEDLYSLAIVRRELLNEFAPSVQNNFRKLNRNVKAQRSLASKVSRYVQSKKEKKLVTQQIESIKENSSAGKIIFIMVLSLLLSSSSVVHGLQALKYSYLNIRTAKWVKIKINGRDIGYTPQVVKVKSYKKIVVDWSSAEGSGSFALTPHKEGFIVLKEDLFKTP